MGKKVFLVLLILLFGCFCSLQAFAVTDVQTWIQMNQISNLPEEYLELYTIIPDGAYHSEHVVTAQTVDYGDWGCGPEGVLIQELFDAGVFTKPKYSSNNPEWENNPDVTVAPVSEVKRVYEETFGPGTFESFRYKNYFTNYGDQFRYDAATDHYEYLPCPFGGGVDSASVYASFEKAEEADGTVTLYLRYGGYQSASVSSDGIFKMYRDSEMKMTGQGTPYYASLTWSEEDLLRSGMVDEHLPLYKHTFRANGAGGYYWESTQMVQGENAEQIRACFEEQKNPSHPSSGETTDSVDSKTHGVTEEKRGISVEILVCLGVSLIALTCMIVPVFIKKKNE